MCIVVGYLLVLYGAGLLCTWITVLLCVQCTRAAWYDPHTIPTTATLLRSFHNGLLNQLCGQKLDFSPLTFMVCSRLCWGCGIITCSNESNRVLTMIVPVLEYAGASSFYVLEYSSIPVLRILVQSTSTSTHSVLLE
jgi:hypothetical protein